MSEILSTLLVGVENLNGLHKLEYPGLLGLLRRLIRNGFLGLVQHNCVRNVSRNTVVALEV